jgi:prophage DNA circulation protein
MSAPAGWQKGSFRGAAFRTEEQEMSGGRRGVLHEFPQAEKPVWEDLGRGARRFHIDCHIVGADYPAGADALADALDAPGVGTLIHPWLGSMQVAVPQDGWSRRDSTVDGGIAWFSIDFLESGLPAPPAPTRDTAAEAIAVADDTAAATPGQFAARFSVTGATAFVETAAASLVSGAAGVTAVQGALLGGIGPTLRTFQSGLNLLGGAGTLVRQPLELGLAVVGLTQALSAIGGRSAARVGALGALTDWGAELEPIVGDTPAREQQRSNQAAIVQLVNLSASAELVRCLAETDFASYDDAVVTRDASAERLSRLALRQADAGDDDGAACYDALRRAMIADLTARGGTLARLSVYTPAVTEPALVIAQRLYGEPSSVADRADEIVARNRVRHPGFVPGGAVLQVLSDEGAAANG